ncbi:keratin-associated protein 13-1-like [Ochotona princeps]|uniref:keratin-associated protein 13-1-like n=1 Tax=Ochotona princeps TaxID=9978 RepID=UPI0027150BBD|nr:keratin-associated protein 13-1-like [Ochotona princeps]
MPYNCYSGNFSCRSFGGYLRYPRSSCGSFYPSNLFCSTGLQSPSTCQLGSTLFSGCQESHYEPASYQTSYAVSSPCQTSCYRPRTSTICSPCRTSYTGSHGIGSSSCYSLGRRSRSSYSSGCGRSGFRPLGYGAIGFPSLGYGSGCYHPFYSGSRTCQSSFRPTCWSGSGVY